MFDGHGSERTVTNSSQTVTGTLNLDAFGVQAGSTGSSTDPYMYAATSGYRNDGDVGLSLVGARYYDAAVGRFITRDTVLTEKPYCYCSGDPVNALDPSGHDADDGYTPPPGSIPLGPGSPFLPPSRSFPVDPTLPVYPIDPGYPFEPVDPTNGWNPIGPTRGGNPTFPIQGLPGKNGGPPIFVIRF